MLNSYSQACSQVTTNQEMRRVDWRHLVKLTRDQLHARPPCVKQVRVSHPVIFPSEDYHGFADGHR